MENKTTVTINMGKGDLQRAMASVIEYLSIYPPQEEFMAGQEAVTYSMGLSALFDCLRATFEK